VLGCIGNRHNGNAAAVRSIAIDCNCAVDHRPDRRRDVGDRGGPMGILSVIGTIIVGLVVGLIARWIFPATVPLGFWFTVGLGIGGAVVGGVIGDLLFRSPGGKFHPAGWLMSIGGALLLLWGYTNYMM
jgi:uncharacterized membrane protein YeaQ/YmgE (transglycosylase-associated protein family)